MNKTDSLLIRLAENKEKASINRKRIQGIVVDLSRFREAWNEDGARWEGWVTALDIFFDNEKTQDEVTVSKLYDERSQLKQELGSIRRSLCSIGRALLRRVR